MDHQSSYPRSRSPTTPLLFSLPTPISSSTTSPSSRSNLEIPSTPSMSRRYHRSSSSPWKSLNRLIGSVWNIPSNVLFPVLALGMIVVVMVVFVLSVLTGWSPVRAIGLGNLRSSPSPSNSINPSWSHTNIPTRPGSNIIGYGGSRVIENGAGKSGSGRIITYLPYTYGWGMLLQTLEGYGRAGWEDIVVIDNSWDHHAHLSLPHLLAHHPFILTIIPTPVHLRFAQIQGFIDRLAVEDGAEVYMWSHTDVLILRNDTGMGAEAVGGGGGTSKGAGASPYQKALGKIADTPADPGVLYFAYDWLSAVYTPAAMAAPWDPSMPQYGADCDRYARIRLAGYNTWDGDKGSDGGIGKIMHLHTVLSSTQMSELYDSGKTIDQQVEFLGSISDSAEQYEWRNSPSTHFDSVTEMDRRAASAEDVGGRRYYVDKWGEPFDCELGGRKPNWDVARMDGWRG